MVAAGGIAAVKFHIVTIFPDFFRGPFEHGVVQKAREAGRIAIEIHDLRTWTYDRHRTVDDRPFGGGEGMLLKPGPIFEAVEAIWPERVGRAPGAGSEKTSRKKVVLLSAQGRKFDQARAREYSGLDELLLICGRYEGVDERVAEHLADEEISIGDYVLSGGELAAAVVVDAVARLREGVLGNENSLVEESFGERGLLDWPQYTRPAEFRGWTVPEILTGGNHAEIRRWRLQAAVEKTRRNRPDLLERRPPEMDLGEPGRSGSQTLERELGVHEVRQREFGRPELGQAQPDRQEPAARELDHCGLDPGQGFEQELRK
jgi:tRNA (guanine37-N1)-methyltransferase